MRAFVALVLMGCGGAGPYGFAREYVPLDAEEAKLEQTTVVTYEEVRRDPADYTSQTLAWFGIVTALDVDESGTAAVSMTYQTLAPRNLCSDQTSGSCRVTVSERPGGPFSARLRLRPEEKQGQDRMWIGSLLRVFGSPTGDFDDEGGPILEATYHRHWPRSAYVTTSARGSMRR